VTISLPLSASLKAVGTIMDAACDPWWIIASGAVALHGADTGQVADVDALSVKRIPGGHSAMMARSQPNEELNNDLADLGSGHSEINRSRA